MMNDLWIETLSDGEYRLGLSETLQEEAGDIEFVNIHKPGTITNQETLLNIEASKAAIEIPIEFSGQIIDIHEEVMSNPTLLNSSQRQDNWVAVIVPDVDVDMTPYL